MKKYHKVIILIISHVIILFVGVIAGIWHLEKDAKKVQAMTKSMSILSHYWMYTESHRTMGSDEAYRVYKNYWLTTGSVKYLAVLVKSRANPIRIRHAA